MGKPKGIYIFIVFISIIISYSFSCTPKIYSFGPDNDTISDGDTIKLNWRTRGRPMLLVHEKKESDDPANISENERLIEFILKFKNSSKYSIKQVTITSNQIKDTLYFNHTNIVGDTMFAISQALPQNLFLINKVTSVMDRIIFVWHRGKMITLPENGSQSTELNTTSIGGEWKVGTLLTRMELSEPKLRPRVLKILLDKKHIQ